MGEKKIDSTQIADFLRTATTKKKPWRTYMSAVILCAGSGTRASMGDGLSKQMREIDGVPMIVRTIKAFQDCSYVDEIVIVARAVEIGTYHSFREKYGFDKMICIVPGGESRQESALLGLKNISEKANLIAIHDGARPLVTDAMIRSVAHVARTRGAASAAMPCVDTPKIVDSVRKTDLSVSLKRDRVWLMQTPQIFRTEIYRAAAYIARDSGFVGTDDCSLVENIGMSCRLVDCTSENIKVTTPSDFMIAEAILRARGVQTEPVINTEDENLGKK